MLKNLFFYTELIFRFVKRSHIYDTLILSWRYNIKMKSSASLVLRLIFKVLILFYNNKFTSKKNELILSLLSAIIQNLKIDFNRHIKNRVKGNFILGILYCKRCHPYYLYNTVKCWICVLARDKLCWSKIFIDQLKHFLDRRVIRHFIWFFV